ncbi:DFP-domain-containing protein, partial [Aureobasidium melanogenum]
LFYLAAAVSDFFIPSDRMVEHKIQSSEDFNKENQDGADGTKTPAARIEGQRLVIGLEPVPKFLKTLVDGWAPEGMIVSFKLETDPTILVKKAEYALNKYSHHLVIGNLLSTRKWEVVFVSASAGQQWIRVPRSKRTPSISGKVEHVGLASGGDAEQDAEEVSGQPAVEIESLIIPEVAKMHAAHMAKKNSK